MTSYERAVAEKEYELALQLMLQHGGKLNKVNHRWDQYNLTVIADGYGPDGTRFHIVAEEISPREVANAFVLDFQHMEAALKTLDVSNFVREVDVQAERDAGEKWITFVALEDEKEPINVDAFEKVYEVILDNGAACDSYYFRTEEKAMNFAKERPNAIRH